MKIELHAHTSETSGCGKMPGEEMIGRFAGAGYKLVVVTDHLQGSKEPQASAEERQEKWLKGYRAAKKAGDRVGVTVLLGAEVRFADRPEDILVYGVKENDGAWLYGLMDANVSQEEFYHLAHERGMLVVQAHPFRKGLNRLDRQFLDGVEVFNGNPRHNSRNADALEYAQGGREGFIRISGSDAHQAADIARGGVITDEEIRNNDDLIAFLRRNPDPVRIEAL